MIQDTNTIFSGALGSDGTRSGQAINFSTLSTNILDTRQPGGTPQLADQGMGGTLWLVMQVLQGFSGLTSLQVTLESDSTSNLATAPVVHLSVTVPVAKLTAGAIAVRMPLSSDDYRRYVAARYTVNGATAPVGSVFTYFSPVAPSNTIYRGSLALDA